VKQKVFLFSTVAFFASSLIYAEDWPEWRGRGRLGVWSETGILAAFPTTGLKIGWRTPLRNGYSGPAVAAGRVFVTDFARQQGNRGLERALCLDERTGKTLWTREWEADYIGLMETVCDRTQSNSDLSIKTESTCLARKASCCVSASRRAPVLWEKDYQNDYKTEVPVWGMTAAPLVEGDLLICLVGGQSNAKVVAFDKRTGREVWRALSSDSEPGYSPPFALTAGGRRQIIIWHTQAVSALEVATGKLLWEVPFKVDTALSVATPVLSGRHLLVSSFYNGSMLLKLNEQRPQAELVWKGKSKSEIDTDGLHALISTPVILGESVYGICSYGQFRCLDLRTGSRVWETLEVTKEKARWATGFLVQNGDRFFINNDRGELIIAKLSPDGYQEISRTPLVKPTTRVGNRRELGVVNWSHPAYANRQILARNDEEILSASLERE
jgi:outer membrane protein assembly factor BamB